MRHPFWAAGTLRHAAWLLTAFLAWGTSLQAQSAPEPTPDAVPSPVVPSVPGPTPAPGPAPSPTPSPTTTGPRGPADPSGLTTLGLLGDTGQVSSGSAYNPAISVILDGVYYGDDRSGGVGAIHEEANGFGAGHSHDSEDEHSHGGTPDRGFSLREAEVAFSGAVDPYFDLWAIVAVADGEIEIEEGYLQTRKLLPGLQLRAGRFLSGFGYVNKQHPHQWDFLDAALPYEMLLGGSLRDTGIQLTWLPSLPLYTQLGIEALQGQNERFSSLLGEEASPFFDEKPGPRLFVGWLKLSPDLGYNHAVQVGSSYSYSRRHQELLAHEHPDDDGEDEAEHLHEAFQGITHVLGFDFVWRYDSPRPYGAGDITVQAEYLRRVKSLDLVGVGSEPAGGETRESVQDGFYAQAGYGLAPRFSLGLRYDAVGLTNRNEQEGERESLGSSWRASASLTLNPTEFSRLRLQYAHGDFSVAGAREKYQQLSVQFQMSLGVHGAHRF